MSMSVKPESERTYVKPRIKCGPSRTKQSFRAISDINNIVKKYRMTGHLENVRDNPGAFLDLTGVGDYTDNIKKVRVAQEYFSALPSELRDRFNNDPARLIAFVSDQSNYDEAVKLGLVKNPETKPKRKAVSPEPPAPVPAKAEKPKASSKASPKGDD